MTVFDNCVIIKKIFERMLIDMKQSSEMLYKFICDYCKPNVLINFCLENYYNADSNSFLIEDITLGVQLVKDEFHNTKENVKTLNDFSSFLEAAKINTIDLFCQELLDKIPNELREEFNKEINRIFDDFNKKTCNPQSFYDIMKSYRNLEEKYKSMEY